jgi:hypothetical protein
MESFNNNSNTESGKGVMSYVSELFGSVKNKITGTQNTNATTQQNNTDNNSYNSYQNGGAGSRRRKCNKKHRHTKSCRKYVKKGRKTRKH